MRNKLKKLAGNILLLCASFFLCLFVLEALCRVFIERPQSVIVENLNKDIASGENDIVTFGIPDGGLYVYTPTGIRLKRSSRAVVKHHWLSKADVEIVTNSLGFRYGELGEKTEEDFRILVLGDSITMGDFVPYEETFPAVVEAYLRKNRPQGLSDKNIQAINAGVGSAGLDNEFSVLMETGLSVRPEVVVLALYLNDAKESLNLKITRLPRFFQHSYLVGIVFNRIDRLRGIWRVEKDNRNEKRRVSGIEKGLFWQHNKISNADWVDDESGFNRLIYDSFDDWGYAWSEGFWDRVKDILMWMDDVSQTRGFELAVVFLPVSYQVHARIVKNEPQQRFSELMHEMHIKHLDLLPGLRDRYKKDGKNLFYDHCHYRGEGNRVIGVQIAEFLINEVL